MRMHVQLVHGYAVIVHDTGSPSDEAWESWLQTYQQGLASLDGVLVYSLGGGPDADQRRRLQVVVEHAQRIPPTVIVSSSRLMRGLVSALNWFLPPAARGVTFDPTQLNAAFDYLEAPEAVRENLRAALPLTRPNRAAR
jgi:hypothetical protein